MKTQQETLLQIGAQHPAWSSNSCDNLVRIFNEVTKLAREAVSAKGETDDQKADWCSKELDRQENKAQHWYGAYDLNGKLRATFDSEPEAYHYILNRGHMYDGTHKPIVNHADKLADDLREILAVAESRSRVNMQNGVSLAAFVRCSLAAYEADQ